jgi:Fic-DOC domain mobile mystery protein B
MNFNYPEGATPLDLDELQQLIPIHITTQQELNAWEEKNILVAQQWALKQKDIVSPSFIRKLHEQMFNKTWKWAGKFRTSEKNIGINWSHISVKIKELCDDVQYQWNHKTYSGDEIAVRFHHRLVWIHPFPNGNGRHARLMADLLVMQQGGMRFSWGMHQDLYKANDVRKRYIEALRCADLGDYAKLLLFARS